MWDALARIIQFILRALSGSAADELAVREAEKAGGAEREIAGRIAADEAAHRAFEARVEAGRHPDPGPDGSLRDDGYRRD